jgi:TfoX/Sxy family transcriptional regulator of competence genes
LIYFIIYKNNTVRERDILSVMATKQSTVDFLTEQMQEAGGIRSIKMFGEYGIYCDNKIIALVCDNQLFVKPTNAGNKYLDDSYGAPPYPGAKNYLRVPEDKWEDRQWMTNFIRETASSLPLPKPKKRTMRS